VTVKFSELAYDYFIKPPSDLSARVSRDDVVAFFQSFSRKHQPHFPTKAIAWDLVRHFGEKDGKALLVWASKLWDERPLTAEDVEGMRWEDNYTPLAWVDVTLVEEIAEWRRAEPPHRNAEDFAAPSPPWNEVVDFARDHCEIALRDSELRAEHMANWRIDHRDAKPWEVSLEASRWQDRRGTRQFHWSSLLWDLRRRYGARARELTRAVFDAAYPPAGRPTYLDEEWANANRPHPRYCDESLVTRTRAWKTDVEIGRRFERIEANAELRAIFDDE
jgi:hypothetical protein